MIKALIWKELRENWLRAALGLLGLTACLALLFWSTTHWRSESPLVSPPTQMITIVGFAIVGLMLGLLQVIPEVWRKQWAFLVQRPITRTSLFWGKVGAGLALYAVATGLPLLGATLWVAAPGNVAIPFSLEAVLPALADMLAGVSYYFAGLAIGMRQARWYGSRALPLGMAIVTSIGTAAIPVFGGAVLFALAGSSVLAVAAWGTIVSGGTYASAPKPAKACLSLSVVAGAVMLIALASWLIGAVAVNRTVADRAEKPYTDYQIDQSGRVIRVHYPSWRRDSIGRIEDVNGVELDKEPYLSKESQGIDSEKMLSFQYMQSSGLRRSIAHYRSPRRFMPLEGGNGRTAWFFDTDERLIQGFDAERGILLGSVGVDGFRAHGKGQPTPFPSGLARPLQRWNVNQVSQLALKDRVYRLHLAQRRAPELVFTAAPGERVIWAAASRSLEPAWISTNQGIHIVDKDRPPLKVDHPLGRDLPSNTFVALMNSGDYVVWQRPYWSDSKVVRVAPTGEVVASTTIPLESVSAFSDPPLGWTLFGIPLSPAGALTMATVSNLVDEQSGWSLSGLSRSFRVVPSFLYMLVGMTFFSGLLCAGLSWRLARRHAFTRARSLAWATLSFTFGPAGLLGFFAVQDWPARQTCSGCDSPRVVTRLSCEHCGTGWPAARRDGSEIFERAEPEPLLLHV